MSLHFNSLRPLPSSRHGGQSSRMAELFVEGEDEYAALETASRTSSDRAHYGYHLSPAPRSVVAESRDMAPSAVMKRPRGAPQEEGRTHKKQRLLSSLGEIVTLLVGKAEVPFSIHKEILCDASPFFEKECKPEWKLTNDRVIKLKDDEPTTIQSMCYWMYHNHICVPKEVTERPFFYRDLLATTQGLFIKLFLVGDKYQMPELRNDAIDALLHNPHDAALAQMSDFIYAKTKPGSKLRRLFVSLISHSFNSDLLVHNRNYICQEFLFDLAYAAFLDRDNKTLFPRHTPKLPNEIFCDFHTHEDADYDGKKCIRRKGFVVEDGEPAI